MGNETIFMILHEQGYHLSFLLSTFSVAVFRFAKH